VTPVVVQFAGVSRDYRGLRPLRIRQLAVGAAEQIAILGFDRPSAEVFVNLVTGATLPDEGTVSLFGRPTSAISDSADWLAVVDRFGIVSERAVLLEQLSVIQNLAMPFTLEIEPPPEDVRMRAAALAAEVGLPEDTWMRSVGSLDAAGQWRVRLGRALALDPDVLLLEHASAGLEREPANAFAADMRSLAASRRAAIIAATADATFAHAVAARVVRLEPGTGRLKEEGRWAWLRGRLG
jgi:predicted ABC-type transport system involved in lysophospholipase L1 biosynthesis ATPase subunit